MLRGSRSIAALAGFTALVIVSAVGATVVFSRATARPVAEELIPSASLLAASTAAADQAVPQPSDAETLSAAVRAQAPSGPPILWSGEDRQSLRTTQAAEYRYEPRFDMRLVQRDSGGSETRVQVDISPRGPETRSPASVLDRMGFGRINPAYRRKGRFYLFAASGNDAVGLNMARDRDGELRRAGFSSEKTAVTGDVQAGVGWRKGPLSASLSYVERQISAFGQQANERFVALTFALRPPGAKTSRVEGDRLHYDDYQRSRNFPR